MKRVFSIFLCFMMLIPFVGCGDKNAPSEDSSEAVETTAEPDWDSLDYNRLSMLDRLQIDYESVPDDLPDTDMGGAEIVIHDCMHDLNSIGKHLIGSDQQTGDIVEDALFARRLEIEERFNCILKSHSVDHSDYNKYVQMMNSIFLSGDVVFDLMRIWNTTASGFAQKGFLSDLSQISTIDFNKPWFYSEATARLSYKNHKFVSVDLLNGYDVYSSLSCVFFNKDMASRYQLGDFYSIVRDGQWTFEYMSATAKSVYSDLNGNSAVDAEEDEFGYECPTANNSYTLIPALGLYMIGKDENDIPYLQPSKNITRFETIFTAIRSFITENDSVVYSKSGGAVFPYGRALFYTHNLGRMAAMRDVGFDIGILPSYKFDESSDGYKSCFLPYPSAIPSVCEDKERAGIILSALAAGGYKKIAVPYFETVVKTKYTTDEDSVEMIDIIASNATTDGVIMFTDAMIYTFMQFVEANEGFTSFWASQEKPAQSYLDRIVSTFDGMLG
ncbi:MAG: hypothetical protein J5933_07145 [Clostridia bacterium]|nr:hypothetical protein [Clostridia bacterium]